MSPSSSDPERWKTFHKNLKVIIIFKLPCIERLSPFLASVSVLDCGVERISVVVEVLVEVVVAVVNPPECNCWADLAAVEVADPSDNVFVAVVENSSSLVAELAPRARSPRCRGSRCPQGGTGPSCSLS